MQNIVVKREELLKILKVNRANHRKIFEEAQAGFREQAIIELDRMLADAKQGRKFKRALTMVEPVDQTNDYDRAIRMLEMSVEDNITLTERDFGCYVMDDWNWRHNFLRSNSFYSKTASDLNEALPNDNE